MRQIKITQKITVRDSKSLAVYLSDISKLSGPLTSDDETQLAQRIKKGDQVALDLLVKANLRFVVSVAKQFTSTFPEISLEDLINEGNVGLIKAAHRFDETRGFKFISYAVWWIRQSIMEYVSEMSRKIRLPLNKVSMLNKIRNAELDLEQRLERPPLPEEVAEHLGEGFTKEGIRDLVMSSQYVGSLNSPVSNDEEAVTLLDLISINDDNDINVKLKRQDLQSKVTDILKPLHERERRVLTDFFGLNDSPVKNLDQIGEEMGLTRERARQIKESGLRRLRRSGVKTFLKEFRD